MALSRLIVLFCFLGLTSFTQAQITDNDVSVKANGDVVVDGEADSIAMKVHSPMKAAIFSAVLPGAGQVYNKKYWKLPIVYGAGIGMAYLISYNFTEYDRYRESLETRTRMETDTSYMGNDFFPTLTEAGLRDEIERYQKNYELAIVGLALVYVLQIVDASVDAHLKTFDVSDDLSMSVRPAILGSQFYQTRGFAPTVGFKLNLRFK